MNKKHKIYNESLKIAIEKVFLNEENVSIPDIIKQLSKDFSFKIQYDKEFYNVLLEFLIDLQNTNGREEFLIKLIKIVRQDTLILSSQQSKLLNQVDILKRLREVSQMKQNKNFNTFQALQTVYSKDKSIDITIEQLNGKYQKDLYDLRLKIEPNEIQQIKIYQKEKEQQCTNFEEYLQNIYEEQKVDEEQIQRLMEEVKFIQNIIKKMQLKKLLNLDYVTVQPYGSLVSGFGQKSSDLDISINTNCYIPAIKFLEVLKNFIDQYVDEHRINVITKIVAGKTPVLEYKRNASIILELDISINNILGCVNSRMLYTLSQIHPIIQKLGIVIKKWAKQKEISSKDNLSSYSFILLMFNFLFNEELLNSYFKLDRDKQKNNEKYMIQIKREKNTEEDFQTNIYYTNNVELLQQDLIRSSQISGKKDIRDYSLSELFTSFIQYYSDIETNEKKRIISIFNLNPQEFRSNKIYKPEFFFNIEDPFDIEHNPGEKTKYKPHIYTTAFTKSKEFIETNQFDLLFSKLL